MGFLGNHTAKVDARRAALLDGVLEQGEKILDHIPVRSLVHPNGPATGEKLPCILFATDRHIWFAAFEGPRYRRPARLPGPDRWAVEYRELRHVIVSEAEYAFLLVVDRPAPAENQSFMAALHLMAPTGLFEPQLDGLHHMACIPLATMTPLPMLYRFLDTMSGRWREITPEPVKARYDRLLRHRAG